MNHSMKQAILTEQLSGGNKKAINPATAVRYESV